MKLTQTTPPQPRKYTIEVTHEELERLIWHFSRNSCWLPIDDTLYRELRAARSQSETVQS